MQKWIRKAAHSLAAAQGADQSREDVIAYGLTALCQMGAILLGALVIGLAAGMVWECLLIYLVVGTFRKCTGRRPRAESAWVHPDQSAHHRSDGGAGPVSAGSPPDAADRVSLPAGVRLDLVDNHPQGGRWIPPTSPSAGRKRSGGCARQSFVYAGVCTLACAGTAAAYWLRPLPTTALSVYASLILALCWQSFTLTAPAGLLLCRRGGK